MTTTTDVAVFVAINDNVEESERGRWMTLGNYESKTEFITAAKKLIGSEVLYFSDVEADFEIGDLITSRNINQKVWGYIALNDTDYIALVQAYETAFDVDGMSVDEILNKAQKALYGRFEVFGDLIRDYRYDLNYSKTEAERGIFKGVNLKELLNHDMGVTLMEHLTEVNDYYFWNEQ